MQQYTPLSQVDGKLVDLRLLANVSKGDIIIAPTPWGRAVAKDGNGKVNISGNGGEQAVFIAKHALPSKMRPTASTQPSKQTSRKAMSKYKHYRVQRLLQYREDHEPLGASEP